MTDNRTTELLDGLRNVGNLHEFAELFDFDWHDESDWTWHDVAVKMADDFEQAIAATLGSERELIDLAHNAWSMALCAMQGMPIPADWGNSVEQDLRKYGINVDEELSAFEVIDDER